MAAESLRHVESNFAGDSIPASRFQWPQTGRIGKHRTSASVGSFTREKRRPSLRDRDRLFWIALRNSGRIGELPSYSFSRIIPFVMGSACYLPERRAVGV